MADPGIVTVGAGLAAAHVLSSLREGGYDGPLTLIGDEAELPYERPPLSKSVLQGKKEPSSVFVHDQQWYDDHAVETRLGDPAVAIDRAARTVTLASGEVLEYADLVLATGASPRTLSIPGADLDGVHTLRRIGDAEVLKDAFGEGVRVVIVGAGWIGLEVAAAAREAGAEVTVLEYAEVPLRAAMGDRLGAYFADLHRRHGVDLRTGIEVSAIEGDGVATGVRAGDEVFPADVVVVGVGAEPNVVLAEQAGLETGNGVLVDARLRTSDPHILAIGDVANAENTTLGQHLRVEHWDNAIRQGDLAGAVLLGGSERYDWQPYFFTDQFDLGMEYVGRGGPDDETVIKGDQQRGEFIAYWLRDGRITAAMNVNIWDVNEALRALIGQEATPDRLLGEAPFLS